MAFSTCRSVTVLRLNLRFFPARLSFNLSVGLSFTLGISVSISSIFCLKKLLKILLSSSSSVLVTPPSTSSSFLLLEELSTDLTVFQHSLGLPLCSILFIVLSLDSVLILPVTVRAGLGGGAGRPSFFRGAGRAAGYAWRTVDGPGGSSDAKGRPNNFQTMSDV